MAEDCLNRMSVDCFLESFLFSCLKKFGQMVWTWCAKFSGPMKPDRLDMYWHFWFLSESYSKFTFRYCFSAVSKFLLLHPFFRDLERYLKHASFYHGHRIVPGVWYSFLVLISVVVLPFMLFGLLTLFSHGWGLSESFECRLLFREFPFLAMSEEVLLDGVKVMCKDVWTNETWLDRCILTLVVCFEIVLQKLTFRSFFLPC